MQKIMWYILVHTSHVKNFIDGYDKSGPAPLFMVRIDELLQVRNGNEATLTIFRKNAKGVRRKAKPCPEVVSQLCIYQRLGRDL